MSNDPETPAAPSAPQRFDAALPDGTLPLVGDEAADASTATGAAPPSDPADGGTPPPDGGGTTTDELPPGAPGGGEGEGDPPPPIDAFICVPGIGNGEGARFLDVAARMATAMERCSSGAAVFSVATRDATTRQGKTLASVAIRRQESPQAEPREVLHLYEYDYRPELDEGLDEKPPAAQAAAITWTLAFSFPSVWWALARRRSKGWVQKLQVVYGSLLFGGMLLYLLMLLVGTGVALSGGPRQAAALVGAANGALAWLATALVWLGGMVVVVPLAGSFMRFNIREVLAKAAPVLTSATGYVAAGRHRNEIIGGLGELLEYLEEEGAGGRAYRKVHLAAYSFGSVVAIDALFQNDGPVARRFGRIGTLVTIGCPYDFLRTYWPRYFQNRYAAVAAQRPRWINVYSPLDVLGSNFINEPTLRERARYRAANAAQREQMRRAWDVAYRCGVELIDGGPDIRPAFDDNVPFGPGQGGTGSFWSWLAFVGFRVHGMYWSRESTVAVNCFEPVLTRIYGTEDAAGVLV